MSLASDTGESAEVHAGDFYEASRLALINVNAAKVQAAYLMDDVKACGVIQPRRGGHLTDSKDYQARPQGRNVAF